MFDKLKQKRCNKAITELEKEAKVLDSILINTINKKQEDPDIELNLDNTIDLLVKYGRLCGIYDYYYKKYDNYPTIERASDDVLNYVRVGYNDNIGLNIFKATHYAVPYINKYLSNATKNIKKLVELQSTSDIFNDKTFKEFFDKIYRSALTAEFQVDTSEATSLRYNLLTKCSSIYNEIFKEKQKNSTYKYSYSSKFENLTKDYQNYISISKNHQFSDIIEDMITEIDNNYRYSDNIKNKKIIYHAKNTFYNSK